MAAKPFVKWAGGKGKLLKTLEDNLPEEFDEWNDVTYIEPFVGGGAMLFHMIQNHPNIRRVVINDINTDLIHCYRLIKDDPDALLQQLAPLSDEFYHALPEDRQAIYYAYRDEFNLGHLNDDERAAMFIFLNRTCFNGLHRVNAAGQFNVPYGRYAHPEIFNERLIQEDHKVLNQVELFIRVPGDYRLVRNNLSRRGTNFVYFDPPYRPISVTAAFRAYSNAPFGDQQQEELKLFCDKLTSLGCKIMLSNSDSRNEDGTSYFEELYEGYHFQIIYAPRAINAFVAQRENAHDTLITNYE